MSATKTEVAAAPAWNHTRQCQAGGANSQEPVLPIAAVVYKTRNAAFMSYVAQEENPLLPMDLNIYNPIA